MTTAIFWKHVPMWVKVHLSLAMPYGFYKAYNGNDPIPSINHGREVAQWPVSKLYTERVALATLGAIGAGAWVPTIPYACYDTVLVIEKKIRNLP
jgi:hypothetical protein